ARAERREPADRAVSRRDRPGAHRGVRRPLPRGLVGQASGRVRLDGAAGHSARCDELPRRGGARRPHAGRAVRRPRPRRAAGLGELHPARVPEPHAGGARPRDRLQPDHAPSDGDEPRVRPLRHPVGARLPLLHPARLSGGGRAIRREPASTDPGDGLPRRLGRPGAVELGTRGRFHDHTGTPARSAMIPVGYMAKRVTARPAWLDAERVKDVYSVSGCVSKNFADYISYWKHNGYWFFDSPELIVDVARDHSVDLEGTTLFFYEAHEL